MVRLFENFCFVIMIVPFDVGDQIGVKLGTPD